MIMASSNDLPQTSGATQPACRIQPAIAFPANANPLPPFAISTASSAEFLEPMHIAEGTHGYLQLYFSEASGTTHGPLHFAQDERREQNQHWLEEQTFRARCVDEDTNEWLAHLKLSSRRAAARSSRNATA